ncbi:MAG TPA: hypothetical protein VGP13_03540 [Candidatus Paceibacterota bacterium]|nr:hypothetical protein [Candidatus Paceibacterota bacterium]
MRERVNSYIGFGFVGAFSCLMGAVIIEAFKSLPAGIPPGSF